MTDGEEICIFCDEPAAWIRHTQFAGNHPFCEKHAKAEEGFGTNDSYEYWEEMKLNDSEDS